jgi:ATP-binding cassette subfamily B multidrug efflux pump
MTKNDLKTAKRLMKYVTEKYKFQFILVFFCILISAVATTAVSLSLRYLLDYPATCWTENSGFCRTL